jgi:chromosome condensin MukBEF ATPase and DNA-binding subunit MukB
MKRDKLTPIELECNMGKDVNGAEHRESWKAYDIDEVDALLAKKDAEIAELKQKLEDVNELIKTARQKLEDVKATAYTESVDAGMRERRLKSALWLARANHANTMQKYNIECKCDGWVHRVNKWIDVERKCRVMAEKFKEGK